MKTVNVNVENMALLSTVIHNIHAAARQHASGQVNVFIQVRNEPPVPVKECMASAMKLQAEKDQEEAEQEAARLEARRKEARLKSQFDQGLTGAMEQAKLEAEAKARAEGISNVDTLAARRSEAVRAASAKFREDWAKKYPPEALEDPEEAPQAPEGTGDPDPAPQGGEDPDKDPKLPKVTVSSKGTGPEEDEGDEDEDDEDGVL